MKHIIQNSMATLLVIFMFGCSKKNDPIPVVEQPQYVATGTINGVPYNITAGLNGYVMLSSQTYDTLNSVAEFKCDFQKENCNPCTNSLHITLRNAEQTLQNQNVNGAIAFTQNYYPFRTPGGNPFHFDVNFNSQTSASPVANYKWIFGDGQISNLNNVTHTYSNPGVYKAGLIVFYGNGCSDTLVNTFRIAVPGSIVKARFTMLPGPGSTINFSNQSTGAGALTYQWDFGDATFSTLKNPTHTYPSQPQIYKVKLIVTDIANHSTEYVQHLLVGSTTGCLANFEFPQITEIANPVALSNTTIEWVDANGVLYSTLPGTQPDGSFMQITSIEDLPQTAKGEQAKKLHVKLNCRVYDSQLNFLDLQNFDAVMVMVYK